MVRHINSWGIAENLSRDSFPIRDCNCDICENARNRQSNHSRVQGVAEAAVSGYFAVTGMIAEPQQDSQTTQSNWAESTMSDEADRRCEGMDRDTRSAGDRRRWSGRRR